MACENAATVMVKVNDNQYLPSCPDCLDETRAKADASEHRIEARPAQGLEQRYPCLIGEAP